MLCSLENLLAFERNGNLACLDRSCNDITEQMRIDEFLWYLQIEERFLIVRPNTYFYVVALFHRCCEMLVFPKEQIRLYLVTCMFLAQKKIELMLDDISFYVNETGFAAEDIMNTEREILDAMNYNIEIPNVMEYIRYICYVSGTCNKVQSLTEILCIVYSMYDFCVIPSVLVTTAHHIACHIIHDHQNEDEYDVRFNPFSIDTRVVFSVSIHILTRVNQHCDDSWICRKIQQKLVWVDIVKDFNLLSFPTVEEISEQYTPKHYIGLRKRIHTINKKYMIKVYEIGSGTYGKVYKSMIDGYLYAYKHTLVADSDQGISYTFIREVSMLQMLSHKNIVTLHFIVLSGAQNVTGIILDLMDYDMQSYIQSPDNVRTNNQFRDRCTKDLLEGLVYMHSNGVLNRDIKPQNILIKGIWPNIEIKYCDFGAVRGAGIVNLDDKYTGGPVTLWYRSIELLLGADTYGPGIDVWALMCTLFEICIGHPLFCGNTIAIVTKNVFGIMGTPTNDTWQGVTLLPNYPLDNWILPSMKHRYIVPSSNIMYVVNKGLIMDPSKRPSAKTLLEYFYDLC